MLFQNIIPPQKFKLWILQEKENKFLLKLSVPTITVLFSIFKLMYPYPNFMPPDSYSYLEAAYNNQFINIWPIGYSKFLRFFSAITNNHFALVTCQYVLLQMALLYFLFTIKYLLSPGKWIFRTILVGSIANPLILHISNFISSDALFTSLSIVWITQLFWLLYTPTLRLVILHSVILLAAFMTRHNALYYPLITLTIIITGSLPIRSKLIGISSIILLLSLFITNSQYEYAKVTNKMQFSAFGGWQLAANALYGYAHSSLDDTAEIPLKFRELHSFTNKHMQSLRKVPYFLRPDHNVDIYYLWNSRSPLIQFMNKKWEGDTISPHFKRWASMAPLYAAYGRYLIMKHPRPFLRYYIWPNLVKYFSVPTEFMGFYNNGKDSVDRIAQVWFGLKHNNLSNIFGDKNIQLTSIFPVILAMLNIIFITCWFAFVILTRFKKITFYCKRILILVAVIWICNMVFSIISAPIVLRYQLFPMFITYSFACLFISFLGNENNFFKPRSIANPKEFQLNFPK